MAQAVDRIAVATAALGAVERATHRVEVYIWVCPTPGCGDFYGSSSEVGRDLNAEMNEMRVDDKAAHVAKGGSPYTHSRGECPDCRDRGKKVPRVLMHVSLSIPSALPNADAS